MNKNEYQMTSLEDKIYVSCFSSPKYIDEIVTEIYDTDKQRATMRPKITMMIKDMEKKGFLFQEKNFIQKIKDKRALRRKYYISNVRPLIQHIESLIKLKPNMRLKPNEKSQIKRAFNHDSFRKFIGYNNYKTIENILDMICLFSIWHHSVFGYYRYKVDIKKRKTKKELLEIGKKNPDLLKKLQKDVFKILNELLPKLVPDYKKVNINIKQQENIMELVNNFVHINDHVIDKLMKMSEMSKIFLYFIGFSLSMGEIANLKITSKN